MSNQKSKRRTQVRHLNKEKNLAPTKGSLQNETIPKSAARVLNAQKIRDEFRKKRKLDGDDNPEASESKRRKSEKARQDDKISLRIKPGESLQHFNRRVEDDMRPFVKSAFQTARSIERRTEKEERESRAAGKMEKKRKDDSAQMGKKSGRKDTSASSDTAAYSLAGIPTVKEFATADSTVPRRLNDVAQAPPEFKKLPRGVSSIATQKKADVVSLSQRMLMEKEREKAILRYRELKAARKQTGDAISAETG